ncbi:MAG: addiction module toxin RelE [Bacteroides sp. SM1_62]|nr:MAG: addiction module toxin RelE [Bacteroides sp. SM23_62]KPL25878.1 MAG: addiction module toxin RelE [Bacteroides sp. SM1_62]
MIRRIIFHKHHFLEFYQNLDSEVQEKIEYVFYIIRNSEIIPSKFFKSLEGAEGLYEIRIQFSNNIFRIFCFFDEDHIVILLHGLQKKSQKLLKKEIIKAAYLRQEYYREKGIKKS